AMANNLISMSKLRNILKMYCDGHSKKHIAQLHATSRNTVRKHIKQFENLHITSEELFRLSDRQLDELFRQDQPVIPQTRLSQLYRLFEHAEKQLNRSGMAHLQPWQQYAES